MPAKKNPESQKEQSERFKKTVSDLVAAGELNPTEADKAFERLLDRVKAPKKN
jgi:polyhydroxyalkanoate synthesis regulator phasin